MTEETTPTPADQPSAAPAKAAAKAKPAAGAAPAKAAKAPAIEDKPFPEFIEQHFIPSLKQGFAEQGIGDIELAFDKDKLPLEGNDRYWQIKGNWLKGQRQFNLYFLEEDIKGAKAFSYSSKGIKPSTIESFMIDEGKVTLDLMVMYTLQRLNGQKWLKRN
jgi:hypothetical protein